MATSTTDVDIEPEETKYKPGVRECGCKGIRSCRLCQNMGPFLEPNEVKRNIYHYCLYCRNAWLKDPNLQTGQLCMNETSVNWQGESSLGTCGHDDCEDSLKFHGIDIIEDFVTKEEEDDLDKSIFSTEFMKSQSGRWKQDFGPKVNFKRQKLKLGAFNGLPSYSKFLYQRMKECVVLEDFEPVEMCNLEYSSDRGAHIDPHFDDTWIWGERLVTLNLISHSILSFTHDSHPNTVVHVPLSQRSLLVVSGSARYEWKHSIDSEHISGRRVAMTFRELSEEFKEKGDRGEEGSDLLKIALSFQGCAVGLVS